MITEKDFKNALILIDAAIQAATSASNFVEEDSDNDPDENLIGIIRDGSAEMDLVSAINSLFLAKDKITAILEN